MRQAQWHGGIREVQARQCCPEFALLFVQKMARFGTAFPSLSMRARRTLLLENTGVSESHERVLRVADWWGRLMRLLPDAVTPPVEYLSDLSLPYLRTPADLQDVQAAKSQHLHAVAAAAYYGKKEADTNARRFPAGAAARPVLPYERPQITSRTNPDRVEWDLTLVLADEDRVTVNQARKKVDVKAQSGDVYMSRRQFRGTPGTDSGTCTCCSAFSGPPLRFSRRSHMGGCTGSGACCCTAWSA